MKGDSPIRDLPGTRVGLFRVGHDPQWRRVRTDGSYASASDPRVLFGLGTDSAPVTVRVEWPHGRAEEWRNVGLDRWVTLKENEGEQAEDRGS